MQESKSKRHLARFFLSLLLFLVLVFLHCCCSSSSFSSPSDTHPTPEKYAKGGPPRRMKKPVTSWGERISRHRVLLVARRGSGESEPRKSPKRYFTCGSVIEPFACTFRGAIFDLFFACGTTFSQVS